ncbi:MAG: WecB/TagA/CpsF family glycosyltransferase [Deltaproteobacteria bacterium]|nr:WecB/TagA/CpsF family glycosyltransferase [Deltaproteobacteria bacterium]
MKTESGMSNNPIAILGIPLDNLTMEETIESIFSMIEAYSRDQMPRLVCTVNTDFVANTLNWGFDHSRHPELLDILRKADLVTADGMPLVWTSALLGSPLKGRVTGADLVPELAGEAALRHKSIYLLGGKGDVAEKAAGTLTKHYPDLIIAGCDSPFVHIEGEQLIDALDHDLPIVERINASGADILLVAFGNPKQELWFERNRHRLEVPVSIGIGGTFEFITGSVQRAPSWMQRTGLEWLFRLTQDPKRLWKRYLVDFLKFGILVWPSILYYNYKKQEVNLSRDSQKSGDIQYNCIRYDDKEAFVVHMPGILNSRSASLLKDILEEKTGKDSPVIVDFTDVMFIDSHGFGFLLNLYYSCMRIFLVGLNPAAERFFSYNRMSHLFSQWHFHSIEEALRAVRNETRGSFLSYKVTEDELASTVSFSGELTARETAEKDLPDLVWSVNKTRCTIDLSHITRIDSSGIIFILKLYREILKRDCACSISGISQDISQMLRITRVENLLHTI